MSAQNNDPNISVLDKRLKIRFGEHADQTLINALFISNSPLKGQFGVAAHPHLLLHTLKKALNMPLNGELNEFFTELAHQRIFISRTVVKQTVNNALQALEANMPPYGHGPELRKVG